MTLNGHESHVMPDGSEHDAGACPDTCMITSSLQRLLDDLDSGALVAVRVS